MKKIARAMMLVACLSSVLQPWAAYAVSSYTLRVPPDGNNVTATTTSVDFGTVPVGPMQQTTGFYKNSTAAPVTLTAGHFTVSGAASLQGNNCLTTLQPGAACSFTAGLTVSSAGAVLGQVDVYPGGPVSNKSILALSATGMDSLPLLQSTPATVDFGSAPLNTGGTALRAITLQNVGTTVADILNVAVSSTNFSVDASQCQLVLAPGDSCVVYAGFSPRQLGTLTSNLRVALASGATMPVTSVIGTGVQGTPNWILPADFSFNNLVQGQASPVREVTLQNSGRGDLKIVNLAMSGDGTFTLVSHDCPALLAPSQTCTVSVQALVNDSNAHNSELVLTTSQSSQPLTKVPLFARALFSQPVLTPAMVEFFEIPVGQTAVQSLILENYGTKPYDVQDLTSTAPFILDTDCPATMAPGESCLINVTFTAAEQGEFFGTVNVSTNATHDPNPTADIYAWVTNDNGFDVSAASLNFGGILVGTDKQLTLEVFNSGIYTTSLQTPTVTGASFTATHNCQAVDPGNSCLVTVTFAPTAAGAVTGSLDLSNGYMSRTVSLTGTGLSGALQVTPSPVNFGLIEVGTSSSQVVTVTNSGNMAVNLGRSVPAGNFALGTSTCGATLAAGQSCTVALTFAPTAAQPYTSKLVLTGATSGTLEVPLLGEGFQQPVTSLDPSSSSLVFGDVAVGSNKSLNVLIENTGNTTFSLDSVTSNNSTYSAVHSCSNVAPGAFCAIAVTFTPTVVGTQLGDLVLASGGSTLDVISMSGRGIDSDLIINPGSKDFGQVPVGETPSQVFTVTNQGAVDATFGTSVGAGYAITAGTCTTVLVAGASCSITVTFSPLELRSYTTDLSLTETSGKVTKAALAGAGIEPPAPPAVWSVNPSALDFGSVEYGSSLGRTITVRNDGTASLPAFDFTVSNPAYTVVNNCAASLAPSETCTIVVTYTPSTWGVTETGTLQLTQSGETRDVSLTGSSPEKKTLAITGDGNFGVFNMDTGTPLYRTFTVTNQSAAAAVGLLSFNVTTSTSQTFYLVAGQDNCTGGTLAAGASCTVQVAFKPAAVGTHTQTLTVTDGAGTSASAEMNGQGGAAVFDIAPTSIDFGKIVTTTTVSRSVEVRNTDPSTTISSLAYSGNGSMFQVNTSACVNVVPGASCLVTVTFNPGTTVGQQNANIVFDANGASRTLSVTGFAGDLYVEAPFMVDIGDVPVNNVVPVEVTYTNLGDLPVSISSFIYEEDGIKLNEAELPACANVAVGATCTTTVHVKVTAQGALWGEIGLSGTFHDAVSGQTQELFMPSFFVMGEGKPGHLLSSAAIAFGDIALGTSSTREVVLSNLSNQPLNIESLGSTGSDYFRASHNCMAVAPGSYCYISATFTPETVGPASGNLLIKAEGGMPVMTVSLDGSGSLGQLLEASYGVTKVGAVYYESSLVVDRGPASLGVIFPLNGYSVDAYSIELKNLSGVNFSLSSMTVTNGVIAGNNCALTLAAGAACTVAVNVADTGTPLLTAMFRTPVGAQVKADVPLHFVKGVPYSVSDSDFGTLYPGDSATRQVTITNNTPYSTTFTLALPSSSFSRSGMASACAGNTLPANTACTFNMTLTPTTADFQSFSTGTVTLTGSHGSARGFAYANLQTPPAQPTTPEGNPSTPSNTPIVIQGPSYINPGFDQPQYSSYTSACGYPKTNSEANVCMTQYYSNLYGRYCQVQYISGPYPYFNSFKTVCN